MVSTCNSKFRIFSRASLSSELRRAFSSFSEAYQIKSINLDKDYLIDEIRTSASLDRDWDREGAFGSAGEGAGGSQLVWAAGDSGEGSGAAAGAGAGAENDFVAIGVAAVNEAGGEIEEAGETTTVGEGTAEGCGPDTVDPLERSTSFRGAVFPLKYSAAVRDGSTEGAGGYISCWNESD